MSDKRYPGLDGLRGIAAVLVILHHTALKGSDIGGLAVFLFFALSGFLITGILTRLRGEIETGRMTGRAALAQFWTQRALRIFPAYYFWLAAFLPFDWLIFKGETLDHLGWYLLYGTNILVGFVTHAWGDFTHAWSLAVEQQYYVFFAPLLLALPRRWHAGFLWAAVGACFAATTALAVSGFDQTTLYLAPSTGFVFMAAGGLLAIAGPGRGDFLAQPAALATALAGLAFLTAYPILERAGVVALPYAALVAASALAVTILLKATLAAPQSRPVRLLETAPLLFLGRISYALYIIHLPLAYLAHKAIDHGWLGSPPATGLARDYLQCAIVLPLTLALATLSWRWVESPFLRLKRRLKGAGAGAPSRVRAKAPAA